MNCPKCNEKIEIMFETPPERLPDGNKRYEVIGRCWDCDFDVWWEVLVRKDGCEFTTPPKPYYYG